MGTNCEACQGKHRAHTCKVVRRTTRGRTRRSPLEAVENALSFCAPGPRMLRMSSCGLCLAKDRIRVLRLQVLVVPQDILQDQRVGETVNQRRRAGWLGQESNVQALEELTQSPAMLIEP